VTAETLITSFKENNKDDCGGNDCDGNDFDKNQKKMLGSKITFNHIYIFHLAPSRTKTPFL
jgi:hypothetical protein